MLSVPRHIRRGVATPALLTLGVAVVAAVPAPALALDASQILAVAQRAQVGEAGGQCKVFVNTVVASASRGRIALSKYHDGYREAGAVEVPLDLAGPGDIIQVTPAGSTDATAEAMWRRGGPLHSSIIEENLGGGRLRVIDSNWGGDERVQRRIFTPVEWADAKGGGIIRVWRFGKGGTAPAASALGDGSFIRVAGTQGVYRLAGAAPLPILSWAAVGGEGTVTEVDWSTLNNFAPFPVDGTVLQSGPGGPLYVVTRGVPRAVHAGTPTDRPPVVVDPLTIRNAGGPGAFSRLRSTAYATKGLRTVTALIGAPRTVKRGARVMLRATVTAPNAGAEGAPVGTCAAQVRRGKRWTTGPSSTLAADGSCTVRVRLTRTGIVRVNFAGATGWKASVSRARSIRVR